MPKINFFNRLWHNVFRRNRQRILPALEYTPRPITTDVLLVVNVDLCIDKNGLEHHTSKYEMMKRQNPQLVVRRGQSFMMDITFQRKFNPDTDSVSFIFTVANANSPNYGVGTLVPVPLMQNEEEYNNVSWRAKIERIYEKHVVVKIMTSPYSAIAKWKMAIDTMKKGVGSTTYTHLTPFYLLFNPWCSTDNVYMEDEKERNEYVLMDTGLIWRGCHNRLRPTVWIYGQFEKDILDCALYLISDIANIRRNSRGDPIAISRGLSSVIVKGEYEGVLEGIWNDNNNGSGIMPVSWLGSKEILQAFYANKKTIKYGQCWIFSGVLATIFRSIGIPCRPVTAYSSAHDTKNSLAADYVVDSNGNPKDDVNKHSIWNFHVWNEVWMERPDIGAKYSKWQVIDATPQDLKDRTGSCGPSSVIAIKNGDVVKPYDSEFIFSEVNADMIYWKYSGNSEPLTMIKTNMDVIGKCIYTKAVGKWSGDEITNNYKYPKRNLEEKIAMFNTYVRTDEVFSRYRVNENFKEVKINIVLEDDVTIGQKFSVIIRIENFSQNNNHTVVGKVKVDSIFYTGKIANLVKISSFSSTVEALKAVDVKVDVAFDEYFNTIVDQASFCISCMASVNGIDCDLFEFDVYRLRKPDLIIAIDDDVVQGSEFEAVIRFDNPLPIPLKNCMFKVDGCGLKQPFLIKLKKNIPAFGTITKTVTLVQNYTGEQTLVVKFTSNELRDVEGYIEYTILPIHISSFLGSPPRNIPSSSPLAYRN